NKGKYEIFPGLPEGLQGTKEYLDQLAVSVPLGAFRRANPNHPYFKRFEDAKISNHEFPPEVEWILTKQEVKDINEVVFNPSYEAVKKIDKALKGRNKILRVAVVTSMHKEKSRLSPRDDKTNPNGEDVLRLKIGQLEELFKDTNIKWELVFVSHVKSPDQSGKVVEDLLKQYCPPEYYKSGQVRSIYMTGPVVGKGGRITFGAKDALERRQGHEPADVVIYTDVDVAVDLRQTGWMLDKMVDDKGDLKDVAVMGSRPRFAFPPLPPHDNEQVINDASTGIRKRFFTQEPVLKGIGDTQMGYKAYPAHILKKILNDSKDTAWTFDTEWQTFALKAGCELVKFVNFWSNSAEESATNLKTRWEMLKTWAEQEARIGDHATIDEADRAMIIKIAAEAMESSKDRMLELADELNKWFIASRDKYMSYPGELKADVGTGSQDQKDNLEKYLDEAKKSAGINYVLEDRKNKPVAAYNPDRKNIEIDIRLAVIAPAFGNSADSQTFQAFINNIFEFGLLYSKGRVKAYAMEEKKVSPEAAIFLASGQTIGWLASNGTAATPSEFWNKNLNKFKAAIFDLDGTIVDTLPQHFKSWKRVLAEEGLTDFDETLFNKSVSGRNTRDSLNILLPGLKKEQIDNIAKRREGYYLELLEKEGIHVYESTLALIKELRNEGFKIGVGSASSLAPKILEKIGLKVDIVVTGKDKEVTAGKPEPDIFLVGARRMGFRPEETIVIGDGVTDVMAGKKGGFGMVVGIDRGGNREELRKVDADIIVSDSSEIIKEPIELQRLEIRKSLADLFDEGRQDVQVMLKNAVVHDDWGFGKPAAETRVKIGNDGTRIATLHIHGQLFNKLLERVKTDKRYEGIIRGILLQEFEHYNNINTYDLATMAALKLDYEKTKSVESAKALAGLQLYYEVKGYKKLYESIGIDYSEIKDMGESELAIGEELLGSVLAQLAGFMKTVDEHNGDVLYAAAMDLKEGDGYIAKSIRDLTEKDMIEIASAASQPRNDAKERGLAIRSERGIAETELIFGSAYVIKRAPIDNVLPPRELRQFVKLGTVTTTTSEDAYGDFRSLSSNHDLFFGAGKKTFSKGFEKGIASLAFTSNDGLIEWAASLRPEEQMLIAGVIVSLSLVYGTMLMMKLTEALRQPGKNTLSGPFAALMRSHIREGKQQAYYSNASRVDDPERLALLMAEEIRKDSERLGVSIRRLLRDGKVELTDAAGMKVERVYYLDEYFDKVAKAYNLLEPDEREWQAMSELIWHYLVQLPEDARAKAKEALGFQHKEVLKLLKREEMWPWRRSLWPDKEFTGDLAGTIEWPERLDNKYGFAGGFTAIDNARALNPYEPKHLFFNRDPKEFILRLFDAKAGTFASGAEKWIELPAARLVRAIELADGIVIRVNVYGQGLKGVVWQDEDGKKHFTPLLIGDYALEILADDQLSPRWAQATMRHAAYERYEYLMKIKEKETKDIKELKAQRPEGKFGGVRCLADVSGPVNIQLSRWSKRLKEIIAENYPGWKDWEEDLYFIPGGRYELTLAGSYGSEFETDPAMADTKAHAALIRMRAVTRHRRAIRMETGKAGFFHSQAVGIMFKPYTPDDLRRYRILQFGLGRLTQRYDNICHATLADVRHSLSKDSQKMEWLKNAVNLLNQEIEKEQSEEMSSDFLIRRLRVRSFTGFFENQKSKDYGEACELLLSKQYEDAIKRGKGLLNQALASMGISSPDIDKPVYQNALRPLLGMFPMNLNGVNSLMAAIGTGGIKAEHVADMVLQQLTQKKFIRVDCQEKPEARTANFRIMNQYDRPRILLEISRAILEYGGNIGTLTQEPLAGLPDGVGIETRVVIENVTHKQVERIIKALAMIPDIKRPVELEDIVNHEMRFVILPELEFSNERGKLFNLLSELWEYQHNINIVRISGSVAEDKKHVHMRLEIQAPADAGIEDEDLKKVIEYSVSGRFMQHTVNSISQADINSAAPLASNSTVIGLDGIIAKILTFSGMGRHGGKEMLKVFLEKEVGQGDENLRGELAKFINKQDGSRLLLVLPLLDYLAKVNKGLFGPLEKLLLEKARGYYGVTLPLPRKVEKQLEDIYHRAGSIFPEQAVRVLKESILPQVEMTFSADEAKKALDLVIAFG
ncbi:MAG: HAD hydrolase-like protein, partial [Candidatus Omnitrophota bacterium]|nr:HAD hydrolase-like protein [Candidatus Omnitrophota bacterium]